MPVVATPAGWISYTRAGSGPPIVLVHGLGHSQQTWRFLVSSLAQSHTVVAVDLPGHGESDEPAIGYSPAAHATALRDLLEKLDLNDVTVIGHSLGGGVAMQFAYQFPELTARLILISPGGLGKEVTPLLRAAVIPGAGFLLDQVARLPEPIVKVFVSVAAHTPALSRDDVTPLSDALSSALGAAKERRTFVREARSVIETDGQAVSALGQLQGLASRPLLLIWGSDDRTIPPRHFRELASRVPGAWQVEISQAGHFPHETSPEAVLRCIEAFLLQTERTGILEEAQ